jgi:hypothetical protein
MKGKSAIHIARTFGGKRRNIVGEHFWARGFWVSTVGHNEAAVRLYIQEQEKADQRLDQLGLFGSESRFERFTFYRPPALPEVADTMPPYRSGIIHPMPMESQASCLALEIGSLRSRCPVRSFEEV